MILEAASRSLALRSGILRSAIWRICSGEPHVEKVGTINAAQIRQIAERKMPDLNANDLDAADKIIAGTARSMGVTVEGL